jgi:hypothetical protein
MPSTRCFDTRISNQTVIFKHPRRATYSVHLTSLFSYHSVKSMHFNVPYYATSSFPMAFPKLSRTSSCSGSYIFLIFYSNVYRLRYKISGAHKNLVNVSSLAKKKAALNDTASSIFGVQNVQPTFPRLI